MKIINIGFVPAEKSAEGQSEIVKEGENLSVLLGHFLVKFDEQDVDKLKQALQNE